MILSNLKHGYIIEFRNGEKALYMSTCSGDIFDYCDDTDRFQPLCEYNKDLKHCDSKKYDVVRVYGYPYENRTTRLEDRRTIIWEEVQSYPILTLDEKMNLEDLLRRGYKYIFQQGCYVSKDNNYKNSERVIGVYFDFLTYWNKEYWDIQELLNNCEVDKMDMVDKYLLEYSNFINK